MSELAVGQWGTWDGREWHPGVVGVWDGSGFLAVGVGNPDYSTIPRSPVADDAALGAMLRRSLLAYYSADGPYWSYEGGELLIDGHLLPPTPTERAALERLVAEDVAARAAHDGA